ncbi:MAG: cyclopropane-fatty-acyl-phospholipid synthase family protein [Bacteroidota bacterium]|nr:cyclopropane-fatty-acyl-phospholipid synthase family protein [Bacteroidota bacterium]
MSKTALDFIVPKTDATKARYKPGKKPSFAHFVEDYVNSKIDLTGNFEEFMSLRYTYFDFTLTPHHFKFFFSRMIPEVLIHSKAQDERIVREHYDRGNDFFGYFLGPRMVYTSGIWMDPKTEKLETAQDRKMQMVCEKLHMKPGDKHLDIGCGWGTLITYAAKHYGTDSTGVTIAQEGYDWGMNQIKQNGVQDRARVLRMDYRDIPNTKYDKITCLEMGEHVGIRKFQRFINQIYDLLTDDGMLYLQQAGLRANPGLFKKGQHWEDLVWGLYMNEYIFSGADASTPLGFLTQSLQDANFEVNTVENIGIHYSHTIHHWYYNWESNKEAILASKYGEWWFRMWQIFLRWSVDIAAHGSSTCWAIIAHKNYNKTDRNKYIGHGNVTERMSDLKVPVTL